MTFYPIGREGSDIVGVEKWIEFARGTVSKRQQWAWSEEDARVKRLEGSSGRVAISGRAATHFGST